MSNRLVLYLGVVSLYLGVVSLYLGVVSLYLELVSLYRLPRSLYLAAVSVYREEVSYLEVYRGVSEVSCPPSLAAARDPVNSDIQSPEVFTEGGAIPGP